MFNLLKQSNSIFDESRLIRAELDTFDINQNGDDDFKIIIGDEIVEGVSLSECKVLVEEGIRELRKEIWEEWQDLSNIAELILHNSAGNPGSLENLYFLNSVKKSFLLSQQFSELSSVSESIYQLYNIDITDVHPNLIAEFNEQHLRVKLLHKLIMQEKYRLHLIDTLRKTLKKNAQVSGPWANLDLPMKERVWEWTEDEEDFDLRERAKRNQTRYNPEYTKEGFYYVWQDLTRDPYRFEDIQTDSPYKHRTQLSIP